MTSLPPLNPAPGREFPSISPQEYKGMNGIFHLFTENYALTPMQRYYTFAATWVVAVVFQQRAIRSYLPHAVTHRYFPVGPTLVALVAQELMARRKYNRYDRLYLQSLGFVYEPKEGAPGEYKIYMDPKRLGRPVPSSP